MALYEYEYDHKLCENECDVFEERYMEYCETLAMQLEDVNILCIDQKCKKID